MDKENVKPWKNPTFLKALSNSINGLIHVIKRERNIMIELCFALFAVIMGIVLKVSAYEWMILIITIFMVLFAELMNTAIENTVDLITEKYNVKAKNAKDISSGAVLVVSVMSVIIGMIIFLPKLLIIFNIIK